MRGFPYSNKVRREIKSRREMLKRYELLIVLDRPETEKDEDSPKKSENKKKKKPNDLGSSGRERRRPDNSSR